VTARPSICGRRLRSDFLQNKSLVICLDGFSRRCNGPVSSSLFGRLCVGIEVRVEGTRLGKLLELLAQRGIAVEPQQPRKGATPIERRLVHEALERLSIEKDKFSV